MDWVAIGKQVVEALAPVIVSVISVLLGKVLFALAGKISSDKIRGYAFDAVAYAEDKIGAGFGAEKLTLAAAWLAKKCGISQASAEDLVRAAFQNLFAPFAEKATDKK